MAQQNEYFLNVQGVGSSTTTGDVSILAAPGTSKYNMLQSINITISSGTNAIKLEDGVDGTVLAEVAGTGAHNIFFSDRGYRQSENTLLNLVGAATTTATVTVTGYVDGDY